MPIYYALVAKNNKVILADYTSYEGNFQKYANQVMERMQPNTKKTFELDEYFFHYVNEDGVSALCMTDKKMNRKLCFAFLQDVKKKLAEDYSSRDLEFAKTNQLSQFQNVIKDKIVSGF